MLKWEDCPPQETLQALFNLLATSHLADQLQPLPSIPFDMISEKTLPTRLCLLLAALLIGTVKANANSGPPNIVFILADDLGYGDPRCYNPGSKAPTPHIDQLAAEGMRFTDAHTASSVCTPSRYALLTGRYPWRSRLKQGIVWAWDPPLIQDERITLPEMLRKAEPGYATSIMGKWHLGWIWPDKHGRAIKTRFGSNTPKEDIARIDFSQRIRGGPLDHGFDTYFGDDVPNFPPYTFFQDDRLMAIPTMPKPKDMFGRPGPAAPGWNLQSVQPTITERAIAYIKSREKQKEPFFLYMPLNIPHTPIVPDTPYQGKSQAGRYGDFIVQTDAIVGRVMKALGEVGLADNTMVVFTSDNGSPARNGEADAGPKHGVTRDFEHVPNAPWRGLKADIWEAGHRVPHIVRWPKTVPPGTVNEQLICLVDWYSTIGDLLGIAMSPDQGEDSISFLDSLKGGHGASRETLVHHSLNGTFAIRKGEWKLVDANLGSGGFSNPGRLQPEADGPQGQLYDLKSDPKEEVNLWLEHPDKVAEMLADLNKIRDAEGSR